MRRRAIAAAAGDVNLGTQRPAAAPGGRTCANDALVKKAVNGVRNDFMDSVEFLDLFLVTFVLAFVAYCLVVCTDHGSLGRQIAGHYPLDHAPYLRGLRRTTRNKTVHILHLGKGLDGIVQLGNPDFTLRHLGCNLGHNLGGIIVRRRFKIGSIKKPFAVVQVCQTGDASFAGA
ncbi:MAG: hypothetical protein A4E65_03253 [Syntrophorhabdus sp. PtaU1.Bin153]|nr:MAG: hypothetical protein A4E65_03253 [Syntrophorhabdus sp. PtaU1.Bin153]